MAENAQPQKVIAVNIKAGAGNEHYSEIDFPKVTKALNEGYTVKQVVSVPYTSTSTLGHTALIFILEKAG